VLSRSADTAIVKTCSQMGHHAEIVEYYRAKTNFLGRLRVSLYKIMSSYSYCPPGFIPKSPSRVRDVCSAYSFADASHGGRFLVQSRYVGFRNDNLPTQCCSSTLSRELRPRQSAQRVSRESVRRFLDPPSTVEYTTKFAWVLEAYPRFDSAANAGQPAKLEERHRCRNVRFSPMCAAATKSTASANG
jgi:hypothetical protein